MKKQIFLPLFLLSLVMLIASVDTHAQKPCRLKLGDSYVSVTLREYDVHKMKYGPEPKYVKTAKNTDDITLIDLTGLYGVVIFESDTFAIGKKYIHADCLAEFENKPIVEEKNDAFWNYISDMDFYEEGMPGLKVSKLKPDTININKVAKLDPVIPKDDRKTIFLHEEDVVVLVGYSTDTAYVFHKDILYTTYLSRLISDQAMVALEKNAREQRKIEEEQYNRIKRELSNKYGEKAAEAILARQVYIGMTQEMVIASWGKPERINSTIGVTYGVEQWVYGYDYLYFDGNTLRSIQTSR